MTTFNQPLNLQRNGEIVPFKPLNSTPTLPAWPATGTCSMALSDRPTGADGQGRRHRPAEDHTLFRPGLSRDPESLPTWLHVFQLSERCTPRWPTSDASALLLAWGASVGVVECCRGTGFVANFADLPSSMIANCLPGMCALGGRHVSPKIDNEVWDVGQYLEFPPGQQYDVRAQLPHV